MDAPELQAILQLLGTHVPPATQLTLVGGSALVLLGSPRLTLDIDFVGDDLRPSAVHQALMQAAKALNVYLEPVPLERFIPLPAGSAERALYIGRFGNLEVFVADPYSIALSKLDRGFDTDFDDLVFLVQNNYVRLGELERLAREAILYTRQFDLSPDFLAHFQELKNRLG